MTRDELHEALLLRAAVEACADECTLGIAHIKSKDTWLVFAPRVAERQDAPTLTEALTALLTDLGAEVPTWPGAETVGAKLWEVYSVAHEMGGGLDADMVLALSDLFAREPLTVLALLAGES